MSAVQYIQLFVSFVQVGLCSIGGGYAALPFIQEQVVNRHAWLTEGEFADVISISQMTPGPIAINAATFVGTKTGGPLGAITATMGCVLPSFFIVLCLFLLYRRFHTLRVVDGIFEGLRPAVVGLIAAAGYSMLCLALSDRTAIGGLDVPMLVLTAVGVFVIRLTKWSPLVIIALCGVVGVFLQ
ncbi:MAG: chromate transporter [Lachnospiraceae bacterium]